VRADREAACKRDRAGPEDARDDRVLRAAGVPAARADRRTRGRGEDCGARSDRGPDRLGTRARRHVPHADTTEPRRAQEGARVPLTLQLDNVSFAYGPGPPVLRSVDLAVERGELVAIAGPHGGVKTTLLRLVPGLPQPSAG